MRGNTGDANIRFDDDDDASADVSLCARARGSGDASSMISSWHVLYDDGAGELPAEAMSTSGGGRAASGGGAVGGGDGGDGNGEGDGEVDGEGDGEGGEQGASGGIGGGGGMGTAGALVECRPKALERAIRAKVKRAAEDTACDMGMAVSSRSRASSGEMEPEIRVLQRVNELERGTGMTDAAPIMGGRLAKMGK